MDGGRLGNEETAQWLRSLAALAEDLGVVPVRSHACSRAGAVFLSLVYHIPTVAVPSVLVSQGPFSCFAHDGFYRKEQSVRWVGCSSGCLVSAWCSCQEL